MQEHQHHEDNAVIRELKQWDKCQPSNAATGSRAFTETLREVIGSRGSVQFKYFK